MTDTIVIIKCTGKGDYASTFEVLINDELFNVRYEPGLRSLGFDIHVFWPKTDTWLVSDSNYKSVLGKERKKFYKEITKAIEQWESEQNYLRQGLSIDQAKTAINI